MQRAFDDTGDGLPPPRIVARQPGEWRTMSSNSMAEQGGRTADPAQHPTLTSGHEHCHCAACTPNAESSPPKGEASGHVHVLGRSFDDQVIHTIKNDCVYANVSNSFPSALVYTISWGGRRYRTLLDTGCSFEFVINGKSNIDANKLMAATKTRHRVKTGGGVVESDTHTWSNQKMRCQGSEFNVNNVTCLHMDSLDYDAIAGLPWLQKMQPAINYRTGELKFKNFSWHRDADVFTTGGIATIEASEVTRRVKHPRKYKQNDRVESVIFVKADSVEVAQAAKELALEPDLTVPGVDPEKQAKVLNRGLPVDQQRKLCELVRKFDETGILTQKDNLPHFSEMRKRPKHWHFKLEDNGLGGAPPKSKPRPMTEVETTELRRQLRWLISHGFLKPSQSSYASGVSFVRKSDGSLRMVTDYRGLNSCTKNLAGPLPDIAVLMDKLGGARYMTALDLVAGYNQLPMHPDSIEKTSITTVLGQFSYIVCPFGISGLPSFFQSIMNELFGEFAEPDEVQKKHQNKPENEGGMNPDVPGARFSTFVANMLDDVLVFSNTFEQHMEHVERVLQRFADNQLYLNLSKCTFGFPDANYLGQVVGSGVRKADPSKVSALLNFPSPTTASELRSWLGLGNYVSDYMRDWARISAVFSEHRGKPKNTKISFSKEQAKAFNELRVAIAAAPVLQLPDFNKPFYLETDASKYAIGSCLLQEVDGKLLPIAFRSVIMSGAQVNWCITEKEMYALVDATAHWRRYLLDRPFVVRTDHKPNTFFQTQPKLTDKLLRWVDHLAMYDPEYVYVPGEDLIYADLLSRPPIESYEAQERPDWRHCECRLCRVKKYDDGQDRFERGPSAVPTKQLFKHTCAACDGEPVTGHVTALVNEEREGACPMWGASPHANHHTKESDVTTGAVFAGLVSEVTGSGDVTLEAIKGAYEDDPHCTAIIEVLESESDQHHYNRKYSMKEGLLLLSPTSEEHHWRIVVPKGKPPGEDTVSIRTTLMKKFHEGCSEGHRDAEATYRRVRAQFFWPNMYAHCVKFIKTCHVCTAHKYMPTKPKGLLQPLPAPHQPWEHVTTDFATCLAPSRNSYTGVVYDAVQVFVDRLSRRVRLLPCHADDTSEATVRNYMDNVYPQMGLPQRLTSDRDPLFTSKFYTNVNKIMNVNLKFTSSHNPRADGQSERVVGVVTTLLRIYCGYHMNNWVDQLGQLEFSLNKHVTRSRGNQTPFLITEGFTPYAPSDFIAPSALRGTAADDYVEKRRHAARLAHDTIVGCQDVMADRYNRSRKQHTYKVGDRVMLKSKHVFPPGEKERPSAKMRAKYVGPYEIIELVGPNAVKVKLTGGLRNHPVFSVDSTKPYDEHMRASSATRGDDEEDGNPTWVPLRIDNYRVNKSRKRREWLVVWTNESEERTWEPLSSFQFEHGTTQLVVEYEENRTGLTRTTEPVTITYTGDRGTVVQEPDGFRVYTALAGETVKSVANTLGVSVQNLLEQNLLRYPYRFSAKFKLRDGDHLRMPIPVYDPDRFRKGAFRGRVADAIV